MNYTIHGIEYPQEDGIFVLTDPTSNLISSISLAVCSILLSITGFFVALQKSRCKNINLCGCLKCDRHLEGQPV